MEYMLSPSAMQKVFMLPSDAVKSYMKTATAEQLRVLLCTMCDITLGIDPERIADELGIPKDNVCDALDFWCDAGVFTSTGNVEVAPQKKKRTVAKADSSMPTRDEIAMMSETDEKLVFLLREAELKFKRPLRFSEIQSLAYLYADMSMSVSLILMLIGYAESLDSLNIGFIDKTAREWNKAGVDSVTAADAYIAHENNKKSAWSIVSKTFGIAERKPSEKELSYCEKWVLTWGFDRVMLKAAYDACIDSKAALKMDYINGILENWHKSGYKKPEDIKAEETKKPPKKKETDTPSYDKELFLKMIKQNK